MLLHPSTPSLRNASAIPRQRGQSPTDKPIRVSESAIAIAIAISIVGNAGLTTARRTKLTLRAPGPEPRGLSVPSELNAGVVISR